jgi:hypothetical protein
VQAWQQMQRRVAICLYANGVIHSSPGMRSFPGSADPAHAFQPQRGCIERGGNQTQTSIPHVLLVPFHAILTHQTTILLLKCLAAVMLFLLQDVTVEFVAVTGRDAERAVA